MRIAVMSDTHDNIPNLRHALVEIRTQGCEMIIHCGDFVAPFMLTELDKAGIPVHGVFGNNDGDQYLLTKNTYITHKNITLHGTVGQLDAEGCAIALMHDGIIAEDLAVAGRFEIVCYGHYHIFMEKKVSDTLLLNPGELLGKDDDAGFCIVDTRTLAVERVVVADKI
ncbi:MAG: YfcE family phosphodiesterase [Thermodesulfobacteriota bacterium]|nr:YfcE family phosphodiesterase [Thermodesulfobacteriota bacterium]